MTVLATTPRIKVHRRIAPTVNRTFYGLVASDAEPDVVTDESLPTVRVDGHDLMQTLAADLEGLAEPVRAVFTLDAQVWSGDRLYFTVGAYGPYCADGCCGGGEGHTIRLDGYNGFDFLARLRAEHGQTVHLTYTLTGYRAPDVTVTLAHPYKGHEAREQVRLPLREAQPLARGRRLLLEQNDQVLRVR